jgi:bacterioferritin-associated ferredoxin
MLAVRESSIVPPFSSTLRTISGEPSALEIMKKTTNIDSAFVCHCARIRHSELLEIFSESSDPSYENFKRQYGIGGQCASCEYEVQAILDEYVGSRSPDVIDLPRRPLRQRILDRSAGFRRWLKRLSPKQKATAHDAAEPRVNSRACMFFIRTKALQSSILVSNVNNPESNINPNHGAVLFRVLLYDADGTLMRQTEQLESRPNETKELFAEDILDRSPDNFIGSVYVEYYDLVTTNTLRPYCVLNYFGPDGRLRSRQHYHDKLYSGIIPGFVQCPSVLMPRRECWVAMVNCGDHEFDATLFFRTNGETQQVIQHFSPRRSVFRSISELFGVRVADAAVEAHFWIESERYVMTYYFWHALVTDVWIGQHH